MHGRTKKGKAQPVRAIVAVTHRGPVEAWTSEQPKEGDVLKRVVVFDPETGASSYARNDAGELPYRESPTGDYSDLNEYGLTWHFA